MLFASFFDVSLVPCYAFGAVVAKTKVDGWKTILSNQDVTGTLITFLFYSFAIAGGLHAITLGLAINLAVTFRRITQLPPDMNPLEDNLTSRHKRNKSSMSTVSTESAFSKRASTVSEKRAPANAYEDGRQPTIPFFHTRQQSTDSFSTYKSTVAPSMDSRTELPSRQYGAAAANSPRSSMVDLKRASQYNATSPPKSRGSYVEVPLIDRYPKHSRTGSEVSLQQPKKIGNVNEAWFTTDSLNSPNKNALQKQGTRGGQYQPVEQIYDDDVSMYSQSTNASTSREPDNQKQHSKPTFSHPNPVASNPPTPNRTRYPRGNSIVTKNSPLSAISTNRRSLSFTKDAETGGDIADNYMSNHQNRQTDRYDISDDDEPLDAKDKAGFKSRGYGELKPGKPPVMVGGGYLSGRQVSSGTDFSRGKVPAKREVSGKVAEEGRANPWGARLRKVSGILM